MTARLSSCFLAALIGSTAFAAEWPEWRGPGGQGHAVASALPVAVISSSSYDPLRECTLGSGDREFDGGILRVAFPFDAFLEDLHLELHSLP